jgi:16S rRNA (guanine(527)-N(7))-methyltransferase RsmG
MKNGVPRHHSERAVLFILEQGLAELDLEVRVGTAEQLCALVSLLHDWSARINLTGHRQPEEIASRLVLDAAALAAALPEIKAAGALVDLGSGAGFPGLPIAILFPDLEVRLVESRKKRHHFQRAVRRELGLHHVTPLLGRAETLTPEAGDVVVAQAMTQPVEALTLMQRWARPGALVVLPASETAHPPDPPSGFGPLELREYRVPVVSTHRKLWLSRRVIE